MGARPVWVRPWLRIKKEGAELEAAGNAAQRQRACLAGTRPLFQSSVLGGGSKSNTIVKLGTVMHTCNLIHQMRQEDYDGWPSRLFS